MKIGDLVKIEKWCKGRGRIAHITETFSWDHNLVMVQYLDKPGLKEKPIKALKRNLELINEEQI